MFQSVVYLRITDKIPDYSSVWKKGSQKSSTGSGFMVCVQMKKGKTKEFILTNAHCVQNSTFIECIKPGYSKSFTMSIYDMCEELDLALLELSESDENNEFWSNIVPAKILISDIYEGSVYVVGFPQGGTNPSITRGIISRYIHMLYNNSIPNVAVQIDAAINPGNSGGPVFNESKEVIGMAFSHQVSAQNMCYMIPSSLIGHYLEDISDNTFSQGVCDLDIEHDSLENTDIRNYLLPDKFPVNAGVVVKNVNAFGTCCNILQKDDILYKINEHIIDQNGMVVVEKNRLPYWYLVRLKYKDDIMNITYIRNKKRHSAEIRLQNITIPRVPKLDKHISKKYYVFAGIVFQSLNYWYIINTKKNELYQYVDFPCEILGDEVVILSEIFTSQYNVGYRHKNLRLLRINGTAINNLKQVYEICEKEEDKYIKFEFVQNHIIVLNWNTCLRKSREIAVNCIGENYHNFTK